MTKTVAFIGAAALFVASSAFAAVPVPTAKPESKGFFNIFTGKEQAAYVPYKHKGHLLGIGKGSDNGFRDKVNADRAEANKNR